MAPFICGHSTDRQRPVTAGAPAPSTTRHLHSALFPTHCWDHYPQAHIVAKAI